MSSLSLQCLSSPSKRDSLDEGYDPDETLKIVVSSDGKKVDIIRDSDEDEYFYEDEDNIDNYDDDDDVIIRHQQSKDFDRWEFMKDPAILAKDTANIATSIAFSDSDRLRYGSEAKEVRFLDMDTSQSVDAKAMEEGQNTGAGKRPPAAATTNGTDQEAVRRQSTLDDKYRDGLMKKLEEYASSSLDSDQAVYNELMKRIKSQSSSELDSDTLVYKELVEKQLLYKQNPAGVPPDKSVTDKSKHVAMEQQSRGLQRTGAIRASSNESNGYHQDSNIPVDAHGDDIVRGPKFHRHGENFNYNLKLNYLITVL